MAFDVRTIAEINLAVQILLTLAMIGAVYMVKNKQFGRHCAAMRIAVLVQILAIIAVMQPSMNGYLAHGAPSHFFQAEQVQDQDNHENSYGFMGALSAHWDSYVLVGLCLSSQSL